MGEANRKMEMVVIGGAAIALPIWILVDAGSIKAPCQPEPRRGGPSEGSAPAQEPSEHSQTLPALLMVACLDSTLDNHRFGRLMKDKREGLQD